MQDQAIRELVLKLTGPQLDALIVRTGIDANSVEGTAPASRAASILRLAEGPGGPGLGAVRRALIATFPTMDFRRRTILMLASCPLDRGKISWAEELNAIQQAVANTEFEVHPQPALRIEELSAIVQKTEPDIIHFSGHGTAEGAIVFEDKRGAAVPLDLNAFAAICQAVRRKPRCILLNACYTSRRSEQLHKAADYLIGMRQEIGDDDAVAFAAGFYRTLAGNPEDVDKAFRLGCDEIAVRSLPDDMVPVLWSRSTQTTALPSPPASGAAGKRMVWEVTRDEFRGREYAEGTHCTVWFATNRKPAGGTDGAVRFSAEREPVGVVHYGCCIVDIPKSHRLGQDKPSWWRVLLGDGTPETRLRETRELDARTFADGVCDEAEIDKAEAFFVFIHGFNVPFESAAIRTAQIKADLKLPVAMFFSWPSFGNLDHYAYDEDSILYSKDALLGFLDEARRLAGGKPVHILAHSMGNRGLLWCLRDLAAKNAGAPLFGQILLAAPDVDRNNFAADAQGAPALAQRMTVYVSNRDRALKVSKAIHRNDRAGLSPPVTVLTRADTVSVTEIDLSFLGHGFYAAAKPVLHDIHELITHNTPPAQRLALQPEKTGDGASFWRIQA